MARVFSIKQFSFLIGHAVRRGNIVTLLKQEYCRHSIDN